jgi:hypothetical protein
MTEATVRTFDHTIELGLAETARIEFRFPKDLRRDFQLTLAAADPATGIVELVLDDFTRGYEMWVFTEGNDDEPSIPLLPDPRDGIRVTLDLNAGQRVGIYSEDRIVHSLYMTGAEWRGDRLRLIFHEVA